MKSGSFELHAVPVQHRGPDCFGFVFEEKPHRPFLAETAQALGVPFGPERRLLVQGQAITLSDGRVVQPDAVLGDWQAGAKLVHIGDCGDTRNLVDVCQHADALVIEATYNESERAMAKQFGHLTARQAAELAQTAQVKHLYLTHISRRYREKELRDEARQSCAMKRGRFFRTRSLPTTSTPSPPSADKVASPAHLPAPN